MNRDDIIRMANEAWLTPVAHIPNILEFAALVAAAEREECAQIAELFEPIEKKDCVQYASIAIRARGQDV